MQGPAPYTDDLPEIAGTLHAALGLSPIAHGVIRKLDLDRIRALPGVVDVFSAKDIPGVNECGSLVKDDPILAGESGDVLRYLGQPVFAVIATTRVAARRAAALAKAVIDAEPRPPTLTPQQAHSTSRRGYCRGIRLLHLREKPAGDTIAEQKILFFHQNPELVQLREQIVANTCPIFPE